MTPEKSKIDVGALGPGMAVLTRHCNADWHGPNHTEFRHGLNARRHVYGLAIASNVETRALEVWAYLLIPAHDEPLFADGCWFICTYDSVVWADVTRRRRIP